MEAGQTVEYTRTVFVPVFPYVGDGAHPARALLAGGQPAAAAQRRRRRAARVQGRQVPAAAADREPVHSCTRTAGTRPKWPRRTPTVEWQWTKKEATLAFKNPKKDATFYLELDSPGSDQFAAPQQVTVAIGRSGGRARSPPTRRQPKLVKLPITAAQLGTDEMAELQLDVDQDVRAGQCAGSEDTRELGVRVFHAFIEPR